jgi:hypothetical protein
MRSSYLKRDAECYSRYFAQIDDEYEGLRAHIQQLEAGQKVVSRERHVGIDEESGFIQGVEHSEYIEDGLSDNEMNDYGN